MEQGKECYKIRILKGMFLLLICTSILWRPPSNLNYDINQYDFIIGNLKVFEGLEFLKYLTHRGELITMVLFAILSIFNNYINLLPVIFVYVHYRYLFILFSKVYNKYNNYLLEYIIYVFFNTRYLWVISAGRFWISILFFTLYLYYKFIEKDVSKSHVKMIIFLILSLGIHNSAVLWLVLVKVSDIIVKVLKHRVNISRSLKNKRTFFVIFIITISILFICIFNVDILKQKLNFYLSSRIIFHNQFIFRNIELLFFIYLFIKSNKIRQINNKLSVFDIFIFQMLVFSFIFIPFYDLNLRFIEASRLFLLVYLYYLHSEYKIKILDNKDNLFLILFSLFGLVIQWGTLIKDIFPFM